MHYLQGSAAFVAAAGALRAGGGVFGRCGANVDKPRRRSSSQPSETKHAGTPTDRGSKMSLYASPPLPRNERQLVFTSSQAARYLGVSLATVRRWTDAGHVSCYRTPGGQRRFSRAQLDDFIASMQRTGSAEEPTVVA